MTTPDGPNSDTAQLIQALRDNARRLGLTWELAMATVIDGSAPAAVSLKFDGDESLTPGAISMIGTLDANQRVYVIQIPPSGLYVVGQAMGPYRARITVGATQPSVVFNGIPANLRSLTIKYKARSTAVANIVGVGLQVGGDTSAAYSSHVVFGTNVTPQAFPTVGGTVAQAGLAAAASAPAGVYGSGFVIFPGWDLISQLLGYEYASTVIGTGAANFRHDSGGGVYAGALSRSTLTLLPGSGSFVAGTDFQLYGEPS